MKFPVTKLFYFSVAVILIITGGLKVYSSLANKEEFPSYDPLFLFMQQRTMMLCVGIVEVVIGFFLFTGAAILSKLWVVFWFSLLLLSYRLGLFIIGFRGNCYCLGKPQSWLYIAHEQQINRVMIGILAYMLSFSAFFLFSDYLRRKVAITPNRTAVG